MFNFVKDILHQQTSAKQQTDFQSRLPYQVKLSHVEESTNHVFL